MIEQAIPAFTKSRGNPRMTQFCLADHQSQFGDMTVPIAEGAQEIRELELDQPVRHDVPQGMVWSLDVTPSGTLVVAALFNSEEFDPSTVAGWTADFHRILAGAAGEPGKNWKTL